MDQIRASGLRNLIAHRKVFGALMLMGTKYLPTIKDIKAAQRFQEKQKRAQVEKKAANAKSQPKKAG